MGADHYRHAVDNCLIASGRSGSLWNQTFIALLHMHRLCLKPVQKDPPGSYHIIAPLPVPGHEPTWGKCWIVEYDR